MFSLVGASVGILFGAVFSNDQQAGGIGVLIGLGLAALGGAMVPIEIFPDTMATIAKFDASCLGDRRLLRVGAARRHVRRRAPQPRCARCVHRGDHGCSVPGASAGRPHPLSETVPRPSRFFAHGTAHDALRSGSRSSRSRCSRSCSGSTTSSSSRSSPVKLPAEQRRRGQVIGLGVADGHADPAAVLDHAGCSGSRNPSSRWRHRDHRQGHHPHARWPLPARKGDVGDPRQPSRASGTRPHANVGCQHVRGGHLPNRPHRPGVLARLGAHRRRTR